MKTVAVQKKKEKHKIEKKVLGIHSETLLDVGREQKERWWWWCPPTRKMV